MSRVFAWTFELWMPCMDIVSALAHTCVQHSDTRSRRAVASIMDHPTSSQSDIDHTDKKTTVEMSKAASVDVGELVKVSDRSMLDSSRCSKTNRNQCQISEATVSQPPHRQVDTALQYQLNHRRLNPRQIQLSSIAGAIGACVFWSSFLAA
jgi:amino acid permease